MPLLPQESFVYPAGLLPTSDFLGDLPWWVLHVHPGAEKAFSCDLLNLRHAFFLPLPKHQRQCADRRLVSRVPLFPGRVLLRGDERAPLAALQTQRVVRALAGLDGVNLRRDKRLRFLVAVDFLRRGLTVEIEGQMLRPSGGGRVAVAA